MAPHSDQSVADRGTEQKHVAISFLVATWVTVLVRIYVRAYMIRNFGWDDSTMILAILCFTMYCAALLYIEAHGGGTHLTDFNAIEKIIDWTLAAQDLYIVTISFLKISLAIFLNRIIVKKWQRVVIIIVVIIAILQGLANFFFIIFRCGAPVGDYLVKQLQKKCASDYANLIILYAHAAVTTVTDWIFACMPVVILWDAKMDIRTKFSVGFILSLGAIGCICSIVRFFYVDGLADTADFFWSATNTAIWSTIEPGTGIIAGSLATMRPLFKLVITNLRDMTSNIPSVSKVSKRISRSFRSNPNSASEKSFAGKPSESEHTQTTTSASMKMKGYSVNQTDTFSSEYMVTHNDYRDGTWPYALDHRGIMVTHHSRDSGDGIEIDRRSSHTIGEEEGRGMRLSLQPPLSSDERRSAGDIV